MPKPDRNQRTTRVRGIDKDHYKRTDRYARQVRELYDEAAREYASLAGTIFEPDPSKPFSFADYPRTQKKAAAIASELTANVEKVIEAGARSEWLAATYRADEYLGTIINRSKLTPDEIKQYEDRNLEGLAAFQGRKVQGLSLSDRVWKVTNQFTGQMELAIDVSLGEGKSAAELSRDVRGLLDQPNRLFRRVRDKYGNLRLSKAAAAYHPGRGVYRSSYQNAMRLARTEINMAYKTADWERWQREEFVVGIRIGLSNNHTIKDRKGEEVPLTDICDELAGDYPKTFKFVGWHPNCRCVITPILKDPKEMQADRRARLRAIMNEEEYNAQPSANEITDVPQGFKRHIEAIAQRSKGWKSQPFYIRDNFKGGTISGGLSPAIPHKVGVGGTEAKPNQPPTPCTKYDNRIDQLKKWAFALGLDVSQLDPLRASGQASALEAELDRLGDIMVDRREEWFSAVMEVANIKNAAKGYDDIIAEADKVAKENDRDPGRYYADCISRLKAAAASLKTKLEAAKKKDAEAAAAGGLPKALAEAKTPAEVEKALRDLGVVKPGADVDLSKCTPEQAQKLGALAYRMRETFALEPLSRLTGDKLKRGVVASANAEGIKISNTMLGSKGKPKIKSAYESSSVNYVQNMRNDIQRYIDLAKIERERLKDPNLSPYDRRIIEGTIKYYTGKIKPIWDKYRSYSCYTIERSAETYLEDSITHEYGHVMHDQILGGINPRLRNTGAYIDAATATLLNQQAQNLYYKYKNSGRLSDRRWLSEYGFTSWKEFIAEANVLFINNDPRLPADVKQWFMDVAALARKRPK